MKTPIEEYIELCPENVQAMLKRLRQIIKDEAPNATEKISWQMPTFVLYGNLIHFALCKKHIGLYPGAEAIKYFDLHDFVTTKGSIHLPLDKPLPEALIRDIVQFNVKNTLEHQQKLLK